VIRDLWFEMTRLERLAFVIALPLAVVGGWLFVVVLTAAGECL